MRLQAVGFVGREGSVRAEKLKMERKVGLPRFRVSAAKALERGKAGKMRSHCFLSSTTLSRCSRVPSLRRCRLAFPSFQLCSRSSDFIERQNSLVKYFTRLTTSSVLLRLDYMDINYESICDFSYLLIRAGYCFDSVVSWGSD